MARGFIQDAAGSWLLSSNTIVDSAGNPQTAGLVLQDESAVDHTIFYTFRAPTSLLPGSPRKFIADANRIFYAKDYNRVFRS